MATHNDNASAPASSPSKSPRKRTAGNAPKVAGRRDKIISVALAVRPAVKRILEAIEQIEALNGERPDTAEDQSTASDHPHPDDTAVRIRAYLASLRPWRHLARGDETDEAMYRGRSLIERLALSSEGEDRPALRLTAEQVADVLTFIHYNEPIDLDRWWHDADISHLCGFGFVLDALTQSLRELGEKGAPACSRKLPDALDGFLNKHWRIALELEDLLTRLNDDDETPLALGPAVRMAAELSKALGDSEIHRLCAGEQS